MDWARVKTILIVVFLAVDMFLIVNLIMKNKSTELTPEAIKSVKQFLAQNNVVLDTEIEKKVLNLSRINVVNPIVDGDLAANKFIGKGLWNKKKDIDGNVLYSSDKESLLVQKKGEVILKYNEPNIANLSGSATINGYFLGVLKKNHIVNAELQTEKMIKNIYYIRYRCYDNKMKVFNNYAEVELDQSSGDISIKIGMIEAEGYAGKKKQVNIIDSLIELVRNVNSKEKTIVKKISLGYYANVNKNEEAMKYGEADPAWEIETDKGIYIFDGYNGNLLYKYNK